LETARKAKDLPKLAEAGQTILLIDSISEEVRDMAREAVAEGLSSWNESFQKVDYQPILVEVNRAIALNNKSSDYYWLRGIIHTMRSAYQGDNEWEQALADYDQAIKMAPDISIYFLFRGDCYGGAATFKHPSGNYNRSISDYTKAIELDPAKAYYFTWRGGRI